MLSSECPRTDDFGTVPIEQSPALSKIHSTVRVMLYGPAINEPGNSEAAYLGKM
jgi:hypothetical protein